MSWLVEDDCLWSNPIVTPKKAQAKVVPKSVVKAKAVTKPKVANIAKVDASPTLATQQQVTGCSVGGACFWIKNQI